MDFFSLDPATLFDSLPSAGNPFSAMVLIFLKGGWIGALFACLWGGWIGYVEWRQNKFETALETVLLAIDIPRGNEQSPKAVEHIFSHISGMRKGGNLKDKYLKGYTQPNVSLELVSIEGYIQFLIRTPVKFRDLTESAIYAQYPEAEITEVEDYVDLIPKPLEFPHEEWDLWGTEYKLAKNDLYPIKTYPFFEHSLTQKFMDPMAALLEIMSRLGPGEHIWIQIVIAPVNQSWKKRGDALVNKLIGKKDSKQPMDFLYFPREVAKGLTESFTASIVPPSEMEGAQNQRKEREWPSMMQHLAPTEKEAVEGISMKIGKLGFKSKIRMIYAAKKDVMHRGRGVYAVNGAFAQFSSQNLNSITINKKTWTKINYFFIKTRTLARKKRILWGYRYRSMKRGRPGYILNIEELASLWHFPVIEVHAPTVKKVDAKKAQAPVDLPDGTVDKDEKPIEQQDKKSPPPSDLPVEG